MDVQNQMLFFLPLFSIHQGIEDVFHEIQNAGRNIERLLAKTVWRLHIRRVVANMTSHLLQCILLTDFGINNQTFQTTFLSHIRSKKYLSNCSNQFYAILCSIYSKVDQTKYVPMKAAYILL